LTITLMAVAVLGSGVAAASAAGASAHNQPSSVLYSSLVNPYSATNSSNDSYSATNSPNSWWSFSFGGNNATQFGDKINLASQSSLGSATVIMDSQACQTSTAAAPCVTTAGATFPVSITFNIYSPGSTAGTVDTTVLATETQTFNVPYRPSADPTECPAGTPSIEAGATLDGTQWFNPATGTCYYGKTYAATFNHFRFTSRSHVLPTTVVYGVSYDASSGPASSLNVLFSTESASGVVTVGSDTDPGNLFLADTAAGPSPEITCAPTVGTSFAEYNTAVGATGCGTDTQQSPTAPYEPIAFVPAVELDGSN
jgi:hypothetical protein